MKEFLEGPRTIEQVLVKTEEGSLLWVWVYYDR